MSRSSKALVRVASEDMELVLVFAYGSNTQSRQMRDRCPSARLVGTAEVRCARLAFAGFSPRWGGAVATLRPAARGVNAPGVVWSITPLDLLRLDAFEGAPSVYFRGTTKCRMTSGGEDVKAVAYALPMTKSERPPSVSYARAVLNGYREHDLPIASLVDAFLEHGVSQTFLPAYISNGIPSGRA